MLRRRMLQRNFDAMGIHAEEPDQDAGSDLGSGGAQQGLSLFALTSAMTRLQAAKLFYQICGAPSLACLHSSQAHAVQSVS
jgi:hypothetical protein